HEIETRSDTIDVAYFRWSDDNGVTWGPESVWPTCFEDPEGTGRRHHRGLFVDERTNRLLMLWTQGVLPGDDPMEGLWRWTLWYAASDDEGKTFGPPQQIIHEGDYDTIHHLPGITVGHNCAMMGDRGERP